MELLEQLTDEFIAIYGKSPARLKNKLSSTIKELTSHARTVSTTHSMDNILFCSSSITFFFI